MALRYNLHIDQGETWELTIPLVPRGDLEADFTGYTAAGQIRSDPASTVVLHEWSSVNGNITLLQQAVVLNIPAAVSSGWAWRRGVWDLELTAPGGGTIRLAEGWVYVRPDTTRQLGDGPIPSTGGGYTLRGATDYDNTTAPTSGQSIVWDGVKYAPTTVAGGGGGGGGGAVASVNGEAGAVVLDAADVGAQPLDTDLTVIAALSPNNDDLLQRKSGAWTGRTPAQVKTDLALVKTDVGLGNVTNDAQVKLSTATTKGDLWVASGSAVAVRRGVGTNGQVLTADSAETDGMKWATPAPAGTQVSVDGVDVTDLDIDSDPIVIADISGLTTALAGKAATAHTHGLTDLTATGTKDATTFLRGDNTWAVPAGGGGGGSSPYPTFASGAYFIPIGWQSGATANATSGNNSLRAMPWVCHQAITINRIGASVTTVGEAGSKVRLGIYADTGAGAPGALVVDAGQINGDSATVQELTISSTALAAGTYWLAAVVQSVTTTQPQLRVVNLTGFAPYIPIPITTLPTSGDAFVSVLASGVSGALPSTFPTFSASSTTVARLILKVA